MSSKMRSYQLRRGFLCLVSMSVGLVNACTFPEQIVVVGDNPNPNNEAAMDVSTPNDDRPNPTMDVVDASDDVVGDDRPNPPFDAMDVIEDRPPADVPTCDANLQTDLNNCGGCGVACMLPAMGSNQVATCAMGRCGLSCRAGFGDCDGMAANGCETDLSVDAMNCGMCGNACGGGVTCQRSVCTQFPSDGTDGAFAPMADIQIMPRIYHFTTILIPAGVTVTVGGTGEAELRATGNIEINGILDVSGGNGGNGTAFADCNGPTGGAGGETGHPTTAANPRVAAGGGRGAPGANGAILFGGGGVPLGGANGGGAGAGPTYRSGAGGGGSAGGGGGGAATSTPQACVGGSGGSANGGTGGIGGTGSNNQCQGGRGGVAPGAYAGGNGPDQMAANLPGCSGGGGSIGARSAADLSVANSFVGGSGGGGGGVGNPRGCDAYSAGGGGGGGGAVRLATIGSIAIRGQVLANGGRGGNGNGGLPVGGGGGGSGGVIDIRAPSINISGQVSAEGGVGGQSGIGGNAGGAGGLGRIRISANRATCTLSGMFSPVLASGCMPAAMAERVYVTAYPQ